MPRQLSRPESAKVDHFEPLTLEDRLMTIAEGVELEPVPARLLKAAIALQELFRTRTGKPN